MLEVKRLTGVRLSKGFTMVKDQQSSVSEGKESAYFSGRKNIL